MEDSLGDFLKTAVRNKEFQGLMSFVVRDGDIFEIDASEYKVHHRLGSNRGRILGAWARCDRKNKMPFLIYLEFDEHKEELESWNKCPSLMMQIKAEEFVLKRAFPLEEDREDKELKDNLISKPQQKRIFAISTGEEFIVRQVLEEYGLSSTSEVPREKYQDICNRIENLTKEFTKMKNTEYPW